MFVAGMVGVALAGPKSVLGGGYLMPGTNRAFFASRILPIGPPSQFITQKSPPECCTIATQACAPHRLSSRLVAVFCRIVLQSCIKVDRPCQKIMLPFWSTTYSLTYECRLLNIPHRVYFSPICCGCDSAVNVCISRVPTNTCQKC